MYLKRKARIDTYLDALFDQVVIFTISDNVVPVFKLLSIYKIDVILNTYKPNIRILYLLADSLESFHDFFLLVVEEKWFEVAVLFASLAV